MFTTHIDTYVLRGSFYIATVKLWPWPVHWSEVQWPRRPRNTTFWAAVAKCRRDRHPLHLHSRVLYKWAGNAKVESLKALKAFIMRRFADQCPALMPASLIFMSISRQQSLKALERTCSLIVGSNEIITLAHVDWLTDWLHVIYTYVYIYVYMGVCVCEHP